MTERLLHFYELLPLEPDVHGVRNAYVLSSTDPERAKLLLRGLSDKGSTLAAFHLARVYQKEGKEGTEEAKRWFEISYKRGCSLALLRLCRIYQSEGNSEAARELWSWGASVGDGSAMYRLAFSLWAQSGQKLASPEVLDLLKRASDRRQFRASRVLAGLYISGKYGVLKIPLGLLIHIRSLISFWKIVSRNEKDELLH